MIFRLATLVLLGSGLSAVSAFAAESTPTKKHALADVIDLALRNRSTVGVAQQSFISAAQGKTVARSPLLPQAVTTFNMLRGRSVGAQSGTNFRFSGDLNSEQGTLNASWAFDGGGNYWRFRQTTHSIRSARAGIATAANSVRLEASLAYFEVLRAQQLLDQAKSNQRIAEAQLDMIRARIKVGDAAPVDELPVRVQVENAKVQVLQALNTVRTNASSLRDQIGLDYGPPLDLEDLPEPKNLDAAPLVRYLDAALSGRPDLIQARTDILTNLYSYRAAKVAVFPTLTLNYGNLQGFGSFSSLRNQWSWQAFVSVPVLNWGSPAATAKQSLTVVRSSELTAGQLRKDIAAQVEQSYLSMTNANERIAASHVEVDAAQKNLDAANAKYRLGASVTVVDVVQAQVQLNQARTNLLTAIYDFYGAQANLEFSVGLGTELRNYNRTLDLRRLLADQPPAGKATKSTPAKN